MNERIIQHMITFIEAREKQLQAEKLSDSQSKSDVVKSILDESEREISNENKQD